MESVCVIFDNDRRRISILVVCFIGVLESYSIVMRAEGFFREDEDNKIRRDAGFADTYLALFVH